MFSVAAITLPRAKSRLSPGSSRSLHTSVRPERHRIAGRDTSSTGSARNTKGARAQLIVEASHAADLNATFELEHRKAGCKNCSGGAPSRVISARSSFSTTAPSPAVSRISRCLSSVLIMLSLTSPPPNITRMKVLSSSPNRPRFGIEWGVWRASVLAPGPRLTVVPGRANIAAFGPKVATSPRA